MENAQDISFKSLQDFVKLIIIWVKDWKKMFWVGYLLVVWLLAIFLIYIFYRELFLQSKIFFRKILFWEYCGM